jgi:hypothetical protein
VATLTKASAGEPATHAPAGGRAGAWRAGGRAGAAAAPCCELSARWPQATHSPLLSSEQLLQAVGGYW